MQLPEVLHRIGSQIRRGLASLRASSFWRKLSRAQKLFISGASTALVIFLVALLILLPVHPQQAFASGVYTNSSVDGDGNTQLASNTVNDTNYYDTSQDSSPDVQQQLGVDPNWKNGVVRESHGVQLNGSNQYAIIPYTASTAIGSNNFTFEGWYKIISNGTLFSQRNGPGIGFDFEVISNGVIRLGGPSGITNFSTASLPNFYSVWHHIAFVRKGSNFTLYFDGTSVMQVSASGSADIGINYEIGYDPSVGRYLNGSVDEFRASNMARYTSNFTPPRRFIEDTNTTALYHFDEGTGTTAKDSSSYGNDGTLVNAPTWSSGANSIQDGFVGCSPDATSPCSTTGGQTGAGNLTLASTSSTTSRKGYDVKTVPSSGLQLDGSNDYINLGNLSGIQGISQFTLDVWVYIPSNFSSNGYYQTIFDKYGGNGHVVSIQSLNSGSTSFVCSVNTVASGFAQATITDFLNYKGSWNEIACVYDGTKISSYFNGQFKNSTSANGNTNTSTANLGIGGRTSADGLNFKGSIDEVRISNTARYSSNFTPSRRFATDASTVALYHLDEGTGTTTADASGNGNTGTLMNGTSNSPVADGTTNGPIWTDGIQAQGQTSSTAWAFPGYQFRTKLNVAAGSSALPAGYGLETTLNRGSFLDNKQTRADGNDWRVAYQPASQKTSLIFNGSNQYVSIPYTKSIDISSSNFSLSYWIKLSPNQGYAFTVSHGYPNGGYYSYAYGTGQLQIGACSGSNICNAATSTRSINDGQWHFFTGTYDGNKLRAYIDGALSGTQNFTGTIAPSTNPLYIGANSGVLTNMGMDEFHLYSRTLSISDIAAQYNGGRTTPGKAGENGLAAGYHFDEGMGVVVLDYAGNQSNGTFVGSPTWSTNDGAVSTTQEVPRMIPHGSALTFDGSNDYIDTGNGGDFAVNASRTIESWFKTSNTTTRQVLVSKELTSAPYTGWSLEINRSNLGGPGSIDFYYCYTSGCIAAGSASNVIQSGAWNHVAVVYSNKAVKFFLNGTLVAIPNKYIDGTPIDASSAAHLNIGSLDGGVTPFSGQISAVRISNTARYAGNFTVTTAPWANDASTVGLWRLGEGSGTTVADSSNGANTGTLMNGSSNSPAADGATNGPIWVKNGGYQDSLNQTDFTTVAPISASTTDSSYYVYYGNLGEKGSAQAYAVNALKFNSGQYVNVSSYTRSATSTVTAWVNPVSTVASLQSVLRSEMVSKGSTQLYLFNGHLVADRTVIGNITSTGAIPAGTWTMVSATFDGTNICLYINGAQDSCATGSSLLGSATGSFKIGGDNYNQWLTGKIDDVRLYNRNLSTAELTALYSNTPTVSNTGLTAWYKLDEGSGTTATDSSGSGSTGALTNFTFDQNSGWIPNRNLLYASPDATVTTINASTPEQESPVFYQWRQAGGTWSTRSQISATPQSLGSEGIQLSFNPEGAYSLNDYYGIESWAVEPFSTTSPQRGKRRSFPDKANILASASGVDIIDASTNKLWMRLSSGTSTNLLGTNAPKKVAALNGHLYTASNDGLTDINLIQDTATRVTSAGTATYAGNLSQRVATLSYGTASGTTLPSTTVNDVAPVTSSGIQYVGVATSAGLSTLSSATGSPTSVTFANTASNAYSHVALASNGKLYGSNTTSSQLDRFDTPFTATTTVTGASASYSTSTTPALISNTINAISVSAGASISDNVSNEVALATSAGTDVLDENTTTASGQVRHYVKQGATGTSGYTEKQFGGGLSLNNTRYASIPAASSLSLSGSGTIEAWIKPTIGGTDILDKSTNNSNVNYRMYLGIQGNATDYHLGFYSSAGGATSTGTVTPNAWNHVAVTISSGTIYFSINGQVSNAASTNFGATNAGNISIGSRSTGGFSFKGQIDEVRISNSTRYTSNFTPSIKEFTRDANTAGLWHFDERSGQTVTDDSGNGNDGTLGATSSASTDDPVRIIPAIQGSSDTDTAVSLAKAQDRGQNLSLNGSTNFIQVPYSSSLNLNTTLSLSAWINTKSGLGNQGIIEKTVGGNVNTQFSIFLQSGSLIFRLIKAGSNYDLTTTTPSVNQWANVAGTWDGTTAKLFVNGIQVNSVAFSGTLSSGTGPTYIGQLGNNQYRFNGQIDDSRIYNRALTSSEVATLYNGGQGRVDNPSSGLVAWYKLNDGGSQTVTDSSGSGNNGTLGANSSIASDDPTVATGSPVQDRGALWIGSNDGSAGGAVTSISLDTDRQVASYQTGTTALPSNNISSLATSASGELALVGTDSGAWNPGTAGGFVDDTQLIAGESGPARLKSGTIRLKGGVRLK